MVWTIRLDGKTHCVSCRKSIKSKPNDSCPSEHKVFYEKMLKETKRRAKENENLYQKRYNWKMKKIVIKMLGGKCVRCGITDIRVLQVNHKNGDGHIEKRVSKHVIRDIALGKRGTDDVDLRCSNCNIIYEYECGRLKVTE